MTNAESGTEVTPTATVTVARQDTIRAVTAAVVVFFAAAYTLEWVRTTIAGQSFEPIVISAGTAPTLVDWLAISIGLAVLVAIHEALHGIVLRRYGGSPSYGVGISNRLLPYAYAGTDGASYTRNQLLAAVLAPVVVITAVGTVLMAIVPTTLLVGALAVNAAGSVRDLRMAAMLVQYPASVTVATHPDGEPGSLAIYATTDERVDSRFPATSVITAIVTGALGTLAVTLLGLATLVFHSLAVGTGDIVVGTDRWLLFRHQLDGGRNAHIELGAPLVGALALAGGLGWALVDRLRRSIADARS